MCTERLADRYSCSTILLSKFIFYLGFLEIPLDIVCLHNPADQRRAFGSVDKPSARLNLDETK
jgi:hypothetical protein